MKNLLVISLDTWREDYVNKVLTPNIVAMLPHASRECFTTATWTIPAHASLFTGLLPIQHGRRLPYPGEITGPTFAEVMGERDYDMLLFARSNYFKDEIGLTKGFANRIVRSNTETDPLVSAVQEFPPLSEPWFLFLHTFTTHNYLRMQDCPDEKFRWRFMDTTLKDQIYQRAKKQDNLFELMRDLTEDGHDCSKLEGADFAILRALYKGHLHYTDWLVGRLLRRIDPARTDVVVFGDHGEALGDHWEGQRQWHHRAACPHPCLVKVPVRANFPLPQEPYSLKDLLWRWLNDPDWYRFWDFPKYIFCEAFSYRDHTYNLVRILDGQYRVNEPADLEFYNNLDPARESVA